MLLFSQPYVRGSGGSIGGSNIFGKSQSLQCAPPSGDGYVIESNYKVASNGFTQTYYMTNYCWENMRHYPAKDIEYNDTSSQTLQQHIMVYDDAYPDKVKDLRYMS